MKNILIALAIVLSGCSSVETKKTGVSLSSIQNSERLQVLVKTGNGVMDKLVYEFAYSQFADLLPLREKEPYTGVFLGAYPS